MALFRVSNERAQFDAAGNDASDQYGAGIRFTQGGNARITTGSATNYNQGIPMSATGQVAIVDATAGLPAGTIFHNGLPISGDKVCVSRNATAVVSNGTPYDSAGAVAADINLDLNFIGTDTLNSSVTFTRASSATFTGSNGLIQSATTNTPRFDYDPVTLAAKGLLIEEQRTNLLTYSEQFDNAAWTKTASTVTANATVSPDGTTTADKLIADTNPTTHLITETVSVSTSTTYTFSCYIKAGEYGYAGLGFQGTGVFVSGVQAIVVNLSTGAVTVGAGSPTGVAVNAGNGWWRVAITATGGTGTATANPYVYAINGTTYADRLIAGDGTSGIFIWGAQLEAGSFATSYIPTVASQVTRSTDAASVNTLSPWFNASEGTLYAEGITSPRTTSAVNLETLASLSDKLRAGRGASSLSMGWFTGSNTFRVFAFTTANATVKTAGGYKSGDNAVVLNGGAPITNTDSDYGTITSLLIGVSAGGTAPFNGHIRRISYFPRRLSNAELQALTV